MPRRRWFELNRYDSCAPVSIHRRNTAQHIRNTLPVDDQVGLIAILRRHCGVSSQSIGRSWLAPLHSYPIQTHDQPGNSPCTSPAPPPSSYPACCWRHRHWLAKLVGARSPHRAPRQTRPLSWWLCTTPPKRLHVLYPLGRSLFELPSKVRQTLRSKA
jgi:hypothetical protein